MGEYRALMLDSRIYTRLSRVLIHVFSSVLEYIIMMFYIVFYLFISDRELKL